MVQRGIARFATIAKLPSPDSGFLSILRNFKGSAESTASTGSTGMTYFEDRRVRCVVTGISGFIGSHLGRELRRLGQYVAGADWVLPEQSCVPLEESCDEFYLLDLRSYDNCSKLFALTDDEDEVHVFHLAADMGGMGFIQSNHSLCILNNSLIDMHMLEAARVARVHRYFYASSACVYPEHLQAQPGSLGLRESDAWPAAPQDGYGLEKLFAEEAARRYALEFGMEVRVARFHNVYGPRGTWVGGREKAPAALCRKAAAAADEGELEVWGDGRQTRSFIYVDDLVEGILRLMKCDHAAAREGAINLGTEEAVTIDKLAEMIVDISGKTLRVCHDCRGPQGVRGRNSDNDLMRVALGGWEPVTSLRDGLGRLYAWVDERVRAWRGAELDELTRSVVVPTAEPRPLPLIG